MNSASFLGLVQNAALLLAVAFIFDIVAIKWRTRQSIFWQILVGAILGFIGIVVMLTSWEFVPGIIFDTRSVLLGISGLFFGPISAVTAMMTTTIFRIYQGGAAAVTGVSVIIASGGIGIAWRYFRRRPLAEISWRELYLFGFLIHIIMLLLMLTLPWGTAIQVLSNIGLPVLVIFPLATTLLGVLMINRLRRELSDEALSKSEEKFRKAFYTSPDAVNINRLEDGLYISINQGFTKIMGYTEEDIIGKTSIECNIWDNPEDRQRLITELQKSGEIGNLEAAFRMKSGDIRYGLMSASVIDLNGVSHILSITRDITDRKMAQEALKESENKYRLLADNASDVIFVLDMDLNYTYVSPSVKMLRGYEPEEILNQPSSQTLTPSSWELAVKTLAEVLELEKSPRHNFPIHRTLQLEMKRKDGTTLWTEVKLSFIRDEEQNPVGILGVTRDITDRKQAEDALLDTAEKLRKSLDGTVQAISTVVEARDPYTAGHQRRSADLAQAIAEEMGLAPDQVDFIRVTASIHDIGKIAIPAEILSKPGRLTAIEYALVKDHPFTGYDILKDIDFSWPVADVVLQHHERIDGSGYPNGLKGNNIRLEARILAVADVIEAIVSHRPYRIAMDIDTALGEISEKRGILYDGDVVDACLKIFREKGFSFE